MTSLTLLACAREEFEVPEALGDDVWYTVDFGHNSFDKIQIDTKATLDIVQESRVLNMYVFLFTKDGNRIYSRYFDKNNKKETVNEVTSADENCWYGYTNDNGYTGGTIRIKAPKASDAILYLIANIDEDMMNISSDLLNTVTSISDLEALNVDLMQTTTSRNGYFPMVARLTGVTVNNTSKRSRYAVPAEMDEPDRHRHRIRGVAAGRDTAAPDRRRLLGAWI